MLTLYECSYTDCSLYGIPRELVEDKTGALSDEDARLCSGRCADDLPCGRLLDRLPEGEGGAREHKKSARPEPPTPERDPTKKELEAAAAERNRQEAIARLSQSSWTQDADVQSALGKKTSDAWASYRAALLVIVKAPAAEVEWPAKPS